MTVQSSRDAGNRKYVPCTISTSQSIDPQFDRAETMQVQVQDRPPGPLKQTCDMRTDYGETCDWLGVLLSSWPVVSVERPCTPYVHVRRFGCGAAVVQMMCRSIFYLYHQDRCELSTESRESHSLFLFFFAQEEYHRKKGKGNPRKSRNMAKLKKPRASGTKQEINKQIQFSEYYQEQAAPINQFSFHNNQPVGVAIECLWWDSDGDTGDTIYPQSGVAGWLGLYWRRHGLVLGVFHSSEGFPGGYLTFFWLGNGNWNPDESKVKWRSWKEEDG